MGVRQVLTDKRDVFADSARVVRLSMRQVFRDRFLARTVPFVVVAVIVVLISTRMFTHAATAEDPRTWRKPLVTGFRLLVTMCLQYVVAAWLAAGWRGQEQEPVRRLVRRLGVRMPSLLAAAAIGAWFELTTVDLDWHTWVRAAIGFAYGYLLSYAVPASAFYGVGLFRAVGHSLSVLRRTFGADLLAWSGLWVVTGVASLVAAVPDALGLYSSTDSGTKLSVVGRLFSWGVILPSTMVAQAVAAAFTCVIFFALEAGRAPHGYPARAVETVSGVRLDSEDATPGAERGEAGGSGDADERGAAGDAGDWSPPAQGFSG